MGKMASGNSRETELRLTGAIRGKMQLDPYLVLTAGRLLIREESQL